MLLFDCNSQWPLYNLKGLSATFKKNNVIALVLDCGPPPFLRVGKTNRFITFVKKEATSPPVPEDPALMVIDPEAHAKMQELLSAYVENEAEDGAEDAEDWHGDVAIDEHAGGVAMA